MMHSEMKRLTVLTTVILGVGRAVAQQSAPPAPAAGRGGRGAPPIQPKAEELAQIRAKSERTGGSPRRRDKDKL